MMGELFPGVGKIEFEGPLSRNPLAFREYNAEEVIAGKTMKEHFRFAMSWWHTICSSGIDMFGSGTAVRPWDSEQDPVKRAKLAADGAFEFMQKLGIEYFCFHDRDIAPEAPTLAETNDRLDEVCGYVKELMNKTGIKLLWGTANLFTHPRYMHGAATSCNADIFAFAAAQVRKAMTLTRDLGGENYVFWGGREGYETLLNTNMSLELDNLARFLGMAAAYAKEIGFTGQLLIEPKPKEPTKHQYDYDVPAVLAFLRKYGLEKDFKINLEANHATLAGHTFHHELHLARINGVLGSIDANQGDLFLGWDTDNFPTDVGAASLAMVEVLKNGGIAPGGFNFDAHVRRPSFQDDDLFIAYIAGMDTFAKGLKVAAKLIEGGEIGAFVEKRYES
jgi:xylose isomerase